MNYKEAAAWLRERDCFLILTHVRPDGDTLGCAAALCAALRQAGKTAWVLPNPGVTKTYLEYIQPYFAPADYREETVVSVDIATTGLFPDNAKAYADRVDLGLDHHPSNTGFAKESCVEAEDAACGELILKVCKELGPITEEIAKPLYVAVSTDTGCFVYGNTTPACHRAAAELMEYGSFAHGVNKKCFRTKSFKRLKMENVLLNSLEFFDGGATAIGGITLQDMADCQAEESDVEDIAAFVGQIEGVRVSATIRELVPGAECKISLRTDDTLSATDVCALLGGGGHAAASGATVQADMAETRRLIRQAIETIQKKTNWR